MEHNVLFTLTEESEAASKQVLAKSEQIRKFQEENKYLGQLVSISLVRFLNFLTLFCFDFDVGVIPNVVTTVTQVT